MVETLHVQELITYPIKGLGGISSEEVQLSETGFQYDRAWMLVDSNGRFISQRQDSRLALFELEDRKDSFMIRFQDEHIELPKSHHLSKTATCQIWDDTVEALIEPDHINSWFSDRLDQEARLVKMPSNGQRYVPNHAPKTINFPDCNQYLVINQSSLDLLNQKLTTPLPMNRFRANIIISGGSPHGEDNWQKLTIGNSEFLPTKKCGRCKVTTIDQSTGEIGLEPLKTLSTYRMEDRSITFGMYYKLVESKTNMLSLGQEVSVI